MDPGDSRGTCKLLRVLFCCVAIMLKIYGKQNV